MPDIPIPASSTPTAHRHRTPRTQHLGRPESTPQHTVTDQNLVDRIHQLGMDINVWTVDEPGAIRKMTTLGVDGIITDYPQSLRSTDQSVRKSPR